MYGMFCVPYIFVTLSVLLSFMKKTYTQKEALQYCFDRLKQSIIGRDDYDRLRQSKWRYERGKLSKKGVANLLEYFGFEQTNEYTYHPEKDKSQ